MQQVAVPFITHSPSQGYTIHPQAIQTLQHLPPQIHCSVIAIVGKAKTGKSYLLNQLTPLLQEQTNQQQQYFPVFNGIGTGTTGVTMMPVHVDGQIVIMLDMEGLGNLTNSSTNEGKLFALTLLLSSVMLYNNVGPLDHQALQGLGILAQISKLVQSSLTNNAKQRLEAPSLMVTLRDFALSLEHTDGTPITSKQYFQEALHEQAGTSTATLNKNHIKKVLKDIFTHRDCFTLSLPSEELPMHYNSVTRKEFSSEMIVFSSAVKEQLMERKVSLNGKGLGAGEWLQFAQDLVKIVNEQENGGGLKLEGLLFQAYRRQQNSIRDRFSMLAQTLLAKAEVKYQQILSTIDVLAQIDEFQLTQSAERGITQLKTLQKQLQTTYCSCCREIEEMVKKQGGGQLLPIQTDYLHPGFANIKDFSDLYHIKTTKTAELAHLQKDLQSSIQGHIKKQKILKTQSLENRQFTLVMEELSCCKGEKEADQVYLAFMKQLKEQGTSLESAMLEPSLLKLEVAYLRRKLECSNREQSCHNCESHDQKDKHKSSALKQTQKANHLPSTSKHNPSCSKHDSKLFTFHSQEATPPSTTQQSTKKSFLIPYLTIAQSQLQIEIIRTLIKQDNRGNNYVQYMMEVVLLGRKWTFSRRWKDFNELHNILARLFSEEVLPEFEPGNLLLSEQLMVRKEEVEVRRDRLQSYILGLLEVSQVRNSRIIQKFLKINKEYVPFL